MKVLIISPYFPPFNAADMQRVRMSLPYYRQFGWEAEVVTIEEEYLDMNRDELLLESLPVDVVIHKVSALPKKWTSKLGLGSAALRSLWFYKTKVDEILSEAKFDLIFFSTTQFPVCILGAYWKKKFGVPYVIDMQDPWHSDYYLNKPKSERPPKYWLAYRLNKYLEPIAMRQVDGLISVSERYINDLKQRYIWLRCKAKVITFGYFEPDMEIAGRYRQLFPRLLNSDCKNLVYVGRGGMDMHAALTPVFKALKKFIGSNPEHRQRLKLYFVGTSYAPAGTGKPSIIALAERLGVSDQVIELTDRISYYHTLVTLQQADALFIPGSDDPKYTASKLYPYLLSKKPMLSVFHPDGPALQTLHKCGVENAYGYSDNILPQQLNNFFSMLMNATLPLPVYNNGELSKHSALNMTRRQCDLFNQVVNGKLTS